MPPCPLLPASLMRVFLLVLAAVVHAAGSSFAEAPTGSGEPGARRPAEKAPPYTKPIEVRHDTLGLPLPVLEMREAILAAARSGDIEEIRTPIEMNEIKPTFGDGPVADPVAHLKAQSADGTGKEVLAALEKLLAAPYAIVPLGRDLENNRIYVWPHFAETGVGNLKPEQQEELKQLVPEAIAKELLDKGGKYTYWRVAIAADGTWHVFSK